MINNPNDKLFTLHGPLGGFGKNLFKKVKAATKASVRAEKSGAISLLADMKHNTLGVLVKLEAPVALLNKQSLEAFDNANLKVPSAVKKEYPTYANCLRADVRYYAAYQKYVQRQNLLNAARWDVTMRCKAARAAIVGSVGKTDKAILTANLKDLRLHALWLMNLQGAPGTPFGTTSWGQGPLISGGGKISPLIPMSVLMPDAIKADDNPDGKRYILSQMWKSKFLDDAMEKKYIQANLPYNKFTYGVKQSGRPYSWPMQALYGKFQGWGPSTSYNLNDVFKEGGNNPLKASLSTMGVIIPNNLPELGWHAFNLNQLKQPGDVYYPKMSGASADAVKEAVKYGIDSGKMSAKGLASVNTYLTQGSRTETFLMEIATKMHLIEQALDPYNALHAASDDEFFKEYLGQPFHTNMLKELVAKGGGLGKESDINTLLGFMYKAGGGKLEKVGLLGELYNKEQAAHHEFNDLQTGGAKAKVQTTNGYVDLLGLSQCKGLPPEVQAFLQLLAQVETYAQFADSQAGTALGLAMSIEELAEKIDDKTSEHTKLTKEKLELDAKYEKCLEEQGKGFGSSLGEAAEKCAKLQAQRQEVSQKRYELAEEISGLARSQGRQGNLRQQRNDTSQETANASLAPRNDTVTIPLMGKDGAVVATLVKVVASAKAKEAVISSKKKSGTAQKMADAAHNKTFANLKKLGENLNLTGLGNIISTSKKIEEVIMEDFIVPLVDLDPPEKKKKAGFPWLLLLAGVGAASGAIPIAAAAGVGALGVYMQSKAKKAGI